MQVHGDEVHARADALLRQPLDELLAIDARDPRVQIDDEQMPCVMDVLRAGRDSDPGKLREPLAEEGRQLLAPAVERVEFLELDDSDRGRYVGEVVRVAE